jgi:hypothetical protein
MMVLCLFFVVANPTKEPFVPALFFCLLVIWLRIAVMNGRLNMLGQGFMIVAKRVLGENDATDRQEDSS